MDCRSLLMDERKILLHSSRRLVAIICVLLQQLHHHSTQHGWKGWPQDDGCSGGLRDDLMDQLQLIPLFTDERQLACQHLIQHHSHTVQITPVVHCAVDSACLLRAGEWQGTEEVPSASSLLLFPLLPPAAVH